MKTVELNPAEKAVIAKVRSYYCEPGGCKLEHLSNDEENTVSTLVDRKLLRRTPQGAFRTTKTLRDAEKSATPPDAERVWKPSPTVLRGRLIGSVPGTCVANALSYVTPRTADQARAEFAAAHGESYAAQIGWQGVLDALEATGWVRREGNGYLLTGAPAQTLIRP